MKGLRSRKLDSQQIAEAVRMNVEGHGAFYISKVFGVTEPVIRNAFRMVGHKAAGRSNKNPAKATTVVDSLGRVRRTNNGELVRAGRSRDPRRRPICILCGVVAELPEDRDDEWLLPMGHRNAMAEPCPGKFVQWFEWRPVHGPRTIEQDLQTLLLCLMIAAGHDPYGRAVWG